jgi:hypothetical protein
MAQYTVAYQPQLDGFTSFFSYQPEWAIGMNNYLYTFKSGQIWKHYINPLRNRYYGGTTGDSTIDICFNDSPTEVKMFKTFSFSGNYPDNQSIYASFKTSLSNRNFEGGVAADAFYNKEGESYAHIISTVNEFDTTLKEQGVGILYDKSSVAPYKYVVRTLSAIPPPAVDPDGNDYGDLLYFIDPITNSPKKIGPLTAYYQAGGFSYYYTDTPYNTPAIGNMIVVSKNITTESFGLRGSYMTGTITIISTLKVELFSISSDIFKSFP